MSNKSEVKRQLAKVHEELVKVDNDILLLQDKKRALQAKENELKIQMQQISSEQLASLNWDRTDYPWSKKLQEAMEAFRITKLRLYQLATMNATLSGQDCILIMPTGGGKSLCFQLPALISKGITIVVSPLVSLMEDQLMALHALGLPAKMLQASFATKMVNDILNEMTEKEPRTKMIYVTPEKMAKSKRFMSKMQKMYQMGNLARLAIDEIHCCSQWGHDFRPDYKFLGIMKRQFPKVPIIGLTATATAKVVCDVQNMLDIAGCLVLKASFNRPNLKYEVYPKCNESIDQLETLLKKRFKNQSGIIYCFTIKESEEIASNLNDRGIKASHYHAQMDVETRSRVHQNWSKNEIHVIVATIAFGMGIDKPDVRFVIHHNLSKSMENFYQESGRAGRDDQPAHCILLYKFADVFRQSTMVFTNRTGLENLYAMVAYCIDSKRCRRSIIAQHFGEQWETSDCNMMCDNCDPKNKTETVEKDCTNNCKDIYWVLHNAAALKERMTAQKLIDAWVGKGPAKLRKGSVNNLSRATCELVVALMLLEGYLKEDFHFTPYSTISYITFGPKESAVESGNHRVILKLPTRKRKLPTSEFAATIAKLEADTSKGNSDTHCNVQNSVDAKPTAKTTKKRSLTKSHSTNTTKTEKNSQKHTKDCSGNDLNFSEWNDIPSSKEKRTVKKLKTEIIDLSD